jgi:hypothetical protein
MALFFVIAALAAWNEDNMAAYYVAIGTWILLYQLHAMEFKLNKLLDHHGVIVWDDEIAKD